MDELRIRGESVTVDPERHDDDHPEEGGRVGGEATGTPGPESDHGDHKREPVGVGTLLGALLGGARKAVEPVERAGTTLPGDEQWRVDVETAIVSVGELVERLIERLPKRVEIAPSESFATGQTVVGTAAQQLIGAQPDRVRVTIYNRHASQSIYIGRDNGVTDGLGFELSAGQSITLSTRGAIYAVAEGAGTTVHYISEVGAR